MTHLDLASLPGSQLFKAALASPERFFQRREIDPAFISERAHQGASRKRLGDLATLGMGPLELSDAQRANLALLTDGNATIVCTGQQVGFLGGPLYTLLKIRSAVQAAIDLTQSTGTPVIPVFWLEDNDHDAAEASTAYLPTTSTTTSTTSSTTSSLTSSTTSSLTHWSSTHDRIPVWQRQFSATELEAIDAALAWLDGQHADAVKASLTTIYHSMHSWTNAFLAILQPYLADWGVLVIRGSHVIDTGLHGPVLERDLLGGGDLERAMEVRTDDLVADGYHAQATIGGVSFFMTVNGERHKVLRDGDNYLVNNVPTSADDLHHHARTSPSDFTPSVLARPLVQDAVLPTIATVLGPGEIAYQAQITPAYVLCGIPQPLVLPRHMACVLDHRTERNLSKYGRPAEWFFRSWEVVEREVADELQERANVPEVDAAAISAFTQSWLDAAKVIDPTLEKTVISATVGMQSTLEALTGKLRAAVKRKNAETLERVRGLWTNIYPDATMNERVFPLALWQSRLGDAALRIIVERICKNARTTLTIIGPTDVE